MIPLDGFPSAPEQADQICGALRNPDPDMPKVEEQCVRI